MFLADLERYSQHFYNEQVFIARLLALDIHMTIVTGL